MLKKVIKYAVIAFIVLVVVSVLIYDENEQDTRESIEIVESIAFAGSNFRSPDDVGADYIEISSDYKNLNLTFAEFTDRWNEASRNMDIERLRISEYKIRYSSGSAIFRHEKENWTLEGLASYEDHAIEEAEVMFDIDINMTSADFFEIASTMPTLIYAANKDYGPDDVMAAMQELGILDFAEIDPDELRDYSREITIDGMTYELRIRTYSGYLHVYPEGYFG